MPDHRYEPSSGRDDDMIPLEPEAERPPSARPARGSPGAQPVPARPSGARKAASVRCPRCGYPAEGLRGDKCPECGTDIVRATRSEERRTEASRQMRREYLNAALLMAGGIAGVAVLLALSGDLDLLPLYLLRFAVMIPTGVLGFFLCSMIWIGFDAPWTLTAIRLAAIYALAEIVWLLMGFVPVPIVGWLVPLLAYVSLLAKYLDLDWNDAFIVAVVTGVLRLLIGMGLVMLMP